LVNALKMTHEISPYKLELKLQKTDAFTWPSLGKSGISTDHRVAASEPISNQAPRPYASKRDWNKIDREMKEELEKDKPEGEEAMNDLFKSIYANASEETRRAMNKSFQTSGGTVCLRIGTRLRKRITKERIVNALMV